MSYGLWGRSRQEYVKEQAQLYGWIKYFGIVNNNEVKNLETQAKVLINPRDPLKPITFYTFPSKLLEYIASGTLTISTKLRGIPCEYFNYLIQLDDVKVDTLRKYDNKLF